MKTLEYQLQELIIEQGYEPKIEKGHIYFHCPGSDTYSETHKDQVRNLLGRALLEFFYGGINTQHIYFNENWLEKEAELFYVNYEFEDTPVNGLDQLEERHIVELLVEFHKKLTND